MATKTIAPLVVVAGPTASGKTALGIELAEQFKGEIICADSRSIYKGMDIGTAKPSPQEQARVPHWGLDLVEPGQYFSAADFKAYAVDKIADIRARGKVPFLVGGTGLYIDAIIFDYQFGPASDSEIRSKFDNMSLDELHIYCIKNSISLPENKANRRYVVRAIEQKGLNHQRRERPISTSIIVGIATDRQILRQRIEQRAEQLFENGVVEEATRLGEMYGWEGQAMTGNIYPLVRAYINGEATFDEIKEKFTTLDWRLAKRQLTWLRRNEFIHWGKLDDLKIYLVEQLSR